MRRQSFRPRPIDVFKSLKIVRSVEDLDYDDETGAGAGSGAAGGPPNPQSVADLSELSSLVEPTPRARKKLSIPTPVVDLVPEYDKENPDTYRPPSGFIRYRKTTDNEAEHELEYSLRHADQVWLHSHPKYGRHGDPRHRLRASMLERMMDLLEKSNGNIQIPILTQAQAEELFERHLGIRTSAFNRVAIDVYNHWKKQRELNKKSFLRRFWPQTAVNDTNPHMVFRPREKERYKLRRHRRSENELFQRMKALREDFSRMQQLLDLIKRREKTKRVIRAFHNEMFEQSVYDMVNTSGEFRNPQLREELKVRFKLPKSLKQEGDTQQHDQQDHQYRHHHHHNPNQTQQQQLLLQRGQRLKRRRERGPGTAAAPEAEDISLADRIKRICLSAGLKVKKEKGGGEDRDATASVHAFANGDERGRAGPSSSSSAPSSSSSSSPSSLSELSLVSEEARLIKSRPWRVSSKEKRRRKEAEAALRHAGKASPLVNGLPATGAGSMGGAAGSLSALPAAAIGGVPGAGAVGAGLGAGAGTEPGLAGSTAASSSLSSTPPSSSPASARVLPSFLDFADGEEVELVLKTPRRILGDTVPALDASEIVLRKRRDGEDRDIAHKMREIDTKKKRDGDKKDKGKEKDRDKDRAGGFAGAAAARASDEGAATSRHVVCRGRVGRGGRLMIDRFFIHGDELLKKETNVPRRSAASAPLSSAAAVSEDGRRLSSTSGEAAAFFIHPTPADPASRANPHYAHAHLSRLAAVAPERVQVIYAMSDSEDETLETPDSIFVSTKQKIADTKGAFGLSYHRQRGADRGRLIKYKFQV